MTSKKPKPGLNYSPSVPSLFSPIDHQPPLSASSKASKLDFPDSESVLIFLESLNAWLNGYFFSRLSLDKTQLPPSPRLENTDLQEVCSTLRLTIGKVREQAIKKISQGDSRPVETINSPQTNSKNLKQDVTDDKKLIFLLDSALKEAKNRGCAVNLKKTGVFEKCEEICSCLQVMISENLGMRSKVSELEDGELIRTKRTEELTSLNKSRQEFDSSLAQVVYPLVSRVNGLQEKKQFYSLMFRHYERFIKHEEEEIRKLLDTSKGKSKKKLKLRPYFLCVFAAICIKKLLNTGEKITLKGLKVKLIDFSLVPNKTLTVKSLPGIISSIHKSLGGSFKQRSTLNSLISASISVFQKFMNDIKAILSILLKNSAEQKEIVQNLNSNLKELEDERDELEGALTRTVEYTKNLEEEIMEMTGDPEYLERIEENTEMSLELESHKKALKGLTSKYNQLEHRMDSLMREHEDLKKDHADKVKRLEKLKEKGSS